jgi:hypothetical protein
MPYVSYLSFACSTPYRASEGQEAEITESAHDRLPGVGSMYHHIPPRQYEAQPLALPHDGEDHRCGSGRVVDGALGRGGLVCHHGEDAESGT